MHSVCTLVARKKIIDEHLHEGGRICEEMDFLVLDELVAT